MLVRCTEYSTEYHRPDTLPNSILDYPPRDLARVRAAIERPTQQQAQLPQFPELTLTETQATTQLDDPFDTSDSIRGGPHHDEQTSPRKRQKISQDTQGEKLRQMLRGNELGPKKRKGHGEIVESKQGSKVSPTSYEATQRVEPPKKPTVPKAGKATKQAARKVSKKLPREELSKAPVSTILGT